MPDSEFDPEGFASAWWKHQDRENAFEDHLLCLGDEGFDFEKVWTDPYDSSLEIGGVPPDCRLNAAQLKLIDQCGFARTFVNHSDGVETHYPQGWRRKRTEKGFIINYWPEGWGENMKAKWIPSGYMTVDPNL